MSNQVCAIIVTYHPESELEKHIAVLRGQVGGLVVVDNRSTDAELVILRDLALRYSFTLLENSENFGIGTALNQGIRWVAAQACYRYVVFFDQDSEATEGFIDALVACLEPHPLRDKIAAIAPRIYRRQTGTIEPPGDTQLPVAQSSGALMPLRVFESQGWFKEELFIDYVDYEYCLRVVAAGWLILRCDNAILSHAPGAIRQHTFLGLYLGTSMNYSPLRHYYSTRNGAWVIIHYWKRHPKWCAREAFRMFKEKIKVSLWEGERRAKLRLSLRGLGDALQGNLGKHEVAAMKSREKSA